MDGSEIGTRQINKDSTDNQEPPDRVGIKSRWPILKWTGCGVVLLAVSVAVYLLVLVPLFQPPIDPSLTTIKIEQVDRNGASTGEEPVFEIRNSVTDKLFEGTFSDPDHPLDPVLAVAREGLKRIQTEVRDYTALMVKQERVNGTLLDEEMMRVKVRHASAETSATVPKSFYLKFESPRSLTGREVIWVEGRNKDKLIAHEGGVKNLFSVNLAPNSFLAMVGNRYPITELGIETLILRMIEKGDRDRMHDECQISLDRNIMIDGHRCTLIKITHPEKRDHFEFYQAKIYVDDEINLPVGYEGFLWPESPGGEPVLIERYFYRELVINPGLGDIDFDPENPDYHFP